MQTFKLFFPTIIFSLCFSISLPLQAQENDSIVVVLQQDQELPAGAMARGHIKEGYEAFKIKCDYATIIS